MKSKRDLAEQHNKNKELYDLLMDLRRQMDENKKSGENKRIQYDNDSYAGYINQ